MSAPDLVGIATPDQNGMSALFQTSARIPDEPFLLRFGSPVCDRHANNPSDSYPAAFSAVLPGLSRQGNRSTIASGQLPGGQRNRTAATWCGSAFGRTLQAVESPGQCFACRLPLTRFVRLGAVRLCPDCDARLLGAINSWVGRRRACEGKGTYDSPSSILYCVRCAGSGRQPCER